jgi:hypothetical protein
MNLRTREAASIAMLAALGLASSAIGCTATEMNRTWTDPGAKGAMLSKVAVIFLHHDAWLRQMGEDTVAARLTAASAVPSYRILAAADLRNRELVKAKLKAQGLRGALIMRITRVTEKVTEVDGPSRTFDGTYDWADAAVSDPTYLQADTTVRMVSNLYSLQDQKLIWSGVSETFDPASARAFMKDAAKAVAQSIQKDRLVL